MTNDLHAGPATHVPLLSRTDEERLFLALQAAWQIESLADAIISAADTGGDLLILSLAIRIRDLSDVQAWAIGDPTETTTADLRRIVHGTRGPAVQAPEGRRHV